MLALALVQILVFAPVQAEGNRWEPNIEKFEAKDKENPPQPGGIEFLGSSSIVGWNLKTSFPGKPYLNRGFGGSQIADSIYFFDRVVVPYQPRLVVFYAGDNDVAGKKTAEQVCEDFQTFVGLLHEKLPETKLIYLSIKLSGKRWAIKDKIIDANAKIQAVCEADEKLTYADVATCLLGENGEPNPELFRKDFLHLSAAGYKLWTAIVKPLLGDDDEEQPAG